MPRDNKKHRGINGGGSIRTKKVIKDGKEYEYIEAKVTVGYDPVTGKQIQKSITGKSKQEVRKKMNALIAEVDKGTYEEASKQTLQDWLTEWHASYVVGKVKPYTSDRYETDIRVHIIPALGKVKLCDLDTSKIQHFYNMLETEKKLSPKTIKNTHGVLHKALEKARRLRLISRNPSEDCELPKGEKHEVQPMEQEDVAALLRELQTEEYRIIYLVTLFAGLRQGEALGLTWDCVDLDSGTIFVNKQLIKSGKKAGATYLLSSTKTTQTRRIYVAPTVLELLKQQREWQRKFQTIEDGLFNNEWNLVFTNELGGHLCHHTVYKRFKAVVRRLDMEQFRFHDLRHECAVANLESGTDIKTVQKLLGHSSAAFTMSVYAHATERMQRQSADNIERFIQNVKMHKKTEIREN